MDNTLEPTREQVDACQAQARLYVGAAIDRDFGTPMNRPAHPCEASIGALTELVGGLMAKVANLAAHVEDLRTKAKSAQMRGPYFESKQR